MGYKNDDPCIKKAYDDERLFVLMTRDITAPKIVLEWIKENLDNQPDEKLREAFECALEMAKNQGYFKRKKSLEELDKKLTPKSHESENKPDSEKEN